MMSERVRGEVGKSRFDSSVNQTWIGALIFDRGNKWRAGGLWPARTVALQYLDEEGTFCRDDSGAAVFQSTYVKLDHGVGGGDITLVQVANLLASCASEEQRGYDYETAELLRLHFGS